MNRTFDFFVAFFVTHKGDIFSQRARKQHIALRNIGKQLSRISVNCSFGVIGNDPYRSFFRRHNAQKELEQGALAYSRNSRYSREIALVDCCARVLKDIIPVIFECYRIKFN